jgi:hypothetical protein
MAHLSQEQFRRLAQLGAQARLEELRQEEAAIHAAFPELFARGGQAAADNGAARRQPMSAAARKAVSVRMRKYWAERRKANAGN